MEFIDIISFEAIERIIILVGIISFCVYVFKNYILKDELDNISFENQILFNQRITEKISELRTKMRADRIAIFQFHNGEYFNSSNSILKLTMTHEVVREGVSKIIKDFKNILVSEYPVLCQKLLQENKYFIDNLKSLSDDENEIKADMLNYGIGSMYYMRLNDINTNMIGFICISFRDELDDNHEINDTDDFYAEFKKLTVIIQSILTKKK
jgi:hypothetical protein